MATTSFWQKVTAARSSPQEWAGGSAGEAPRGSQGTVKLWMALDAITIIGSGMIATIYVMRTNPMEEVGEFWNGRLFQGRSLGLLLALAAGFVISLIMTSRRLKLYEPERLNSFLHEQRLSAQACLTSGLLLTGTLYLVRAEDIPRSIVLITLGMVTVVLSLRRLIYRFTLYHRFESGIGTRNVLIVGSGPEAHALRHHLESIRHLGYTFKGFIEFPGAEQSSRQPRGTWWARSTCSFSTCGSSLWTRFSLRLRASGA